MKKILLGALLGGAGTYAGVSYFNDNKNQGLTHN